MGAAPCRMCGGKRLALRVCRRRPDTADGLAAGHRLLGVLHEAGLAHGDPHLANWVQRDGIVYALDCAPRRSLLPALAAAYDFVLLRNCEPALLPLIPGRSGLWWHLALARDAWVHGLRRLKRRLRGG